MLKLKGRKCPHKGIGLGRSGSSAPSEFAHRRPSPALRLAWSASTSTSGCGRRGRGRAAEDMCSSRSPGLAQPWGPLSSSPARGGLTQPGSLATLPRRWPRPSLPNTVASPAMGPRNHALGRLRRSPWWWMQVRRGGRRADLGEELLRSQTEANAGRKDAICGPVHSDDTLFGTAFRG
jgi:hypothetical protein